MMGGMGQGQMMGGMGMMADLATLPAPRLEAVFMSMMIPHHQDAIDMAKSVSGRATHAELVQLAERIIATQTEENTRMAAWLAAWYGL
jgi:uncharacterized protein (DUF305 family)